MMMTIAILKRFWLPSLIFLIVLGVLYVAYIHGVSTANIKWQAKYNAVIVQAQARVRAVEQNAVREQAALESTYVKRVADVQSKTDRIIDDLRAGRIRLRNGLKTGLCASMSHLASSTSQCDAACAGGLSTEHAEDLIRLAARAQATAEQLIAAQQLIILDRKICVSN